MPYLCGEESQRHRVWNDVTLSWDAMVQPSTAAGGGSTVITISTGSIGISSVTSLPLPANAATDTGVLAIRDRLPVLYATRSDTFSSTGAGTVINLSTNPLSVFALQVKGNVLPALWDVRLEGSLNNAQFSQILQHTDVIGDGSVLWTGAVRSPALYIRSRVAGLTLGTSTQITVTILGMRG